MNEAAFAVEVGGGCEGRVDGSIGKKALDLAMPVDDTVADLYNDDATGGDLGIHEAGDGLVTHEAGGG